MADTSKMIHSHSGVGRNKYPKALLGTRERKRKSQSSLAGQG